MERLEDIKYEMASLPDFLYDPKKFFTHNKEKSRILLPLLLVIASAILLAVVSTPIVLRDQEVLSKMVEKGNDTIGIVIIITSIVGSGIGTLFSMLISSLIIYLCIRFILKAQTGYKKVLSIYTFSCIPNIIVNLIYTAVYIITDHISTSLPATILLNVNPFTIWSALLLIIGVHAVCDTSIKKTSILFVILAVLSAGISIATSLI